VTDIFLSVVNMSLTASYVILFIILVRLPLKKAPKVISYALWAVAGFRLVFPFSLESVFSLIPFKAVPIPVDIATQPIPRFNSGITMVDNAVSQMLPAATPAASINPLQVWQTVGTYLWLAGIVVMLIYSVVSIVILRSRLKSARQTERNIYVADNLRTPFVLGIFRPRVYIPAGLTAEEDSYIIRHEQAHIQRFDHIIKPFAFLVLSIHWFNPLVWIAFVLMGTDMELSCDERVIKEMGFDIKKAYSASLLSMAAGKRIINGSPLAFGEGNVKGRIKNILNFKKPTAWIVAVSVLLVAAMGVGLAINPIDSASESALEIYHFPSYEYDRVTFSTDTEIYSSSFTAITGKLTNTDMESGLTCGKSFTLVKQVAKTWRIVPFKEGTAFNDAETLLNVGDSATYTLKADMLASELGTGIYRIVAEVWYANETQPRSAHIVWAEFSVYEHQSELTQKNVRELSLKGDALTFGDFINFHGADASSNLDYHIMVYGVEGGYRLIVRTDGKQLDNVILESIWKNSGTGIDIRYNDVDEFIKNHPSSEAGVKSDTSTKITYTEDEIQTAKECVRKYFSEVATSRILNDLWFDEDACTTDRTSYMKYGGGSENGVSEGNVIILLCNFTIENDEAFNGYYTNWMMILIRDSPDGAWRVGDQGY
jgi:beta-lactamase regulating signal transducer with metallopeptidase domain